MIYFVQAVIRKITKSSYPHLVLRWEARPGLAATHVQPERVMCLHTEDVRLECVDLINKSTKIKMKQNELEEKFICSIYIHYNN